MSIFYIIGFWFLLAIVSILCLVVSALWASNSAQNIINDRIFDTMKTLARYIDSKEEKH